MIGIFNNALADMLAGIRMWRVWTALATEDIGDQHRRTTLGPVWLLVNYLLFAGTFIFVFHRGDNTMSSYPAYVSTGLLVWFYIMEILNGSVELFVREEGFIKGTRLPLSVYVLRLFAQSLMRAGYAAAGCLVILLLSGAKITITWLAAPFGIALVIATAPAAITIFAMLGAFFPDARFIISNLMRVGMFLTPVFWNYEKARGIRAIFSHWNPFTYFLEVVRMPIVDNHVPLMAFGLCLVMSATLWLLALLALGSLRRRLVFVL